jgi:DNA ligase (NAD+)
MPEVASIVKRLEEANHAYRNGLDEIMTDDEYDALKDKLEELDPEHPFLTKIGAPIETGDEVTLPIPLPSLNKAKPGTLAKWLSKNPAASYMVSAKLDGCSALWIPETRKLYTRGDGVKGRDISQFAPYFKGFPAASALAAIRGELIMRTDSHAVPEGKLARNIVAGILNRQEVDPKLFGEVYFVAYELIEPATLAPKQSNTALKAAGFETARATLVKAAEMTEVHLSAIFDAAVKASQYQLDGIVVAPEVARAKALSGLTNPTDRIAWKTRGELEKKQTTVREVEWNVSHTGYLIPRILYDPVVVGGATNTAVTGIHARWIYDNGIGPGAVIEITRAGSTIPKVAAVLTSVNPSMPPRYQWVSAVTEGGPPPAGVVHILPVGANSGELDQSKIVHALAELRVEHVGAGMVTKLFEGGFTTLRSLYDAKPDDFLKVPGVKATMASKLFEGLRAGQPSWTELDLMVASSTMPRTVGRTKLAAMLERGPISEWASLGQSPIPGISPDTIQQIVAALPDYTKWRHENFPAVPVKVAAAVGTAGSVVMTGERDAELIATLLAKGFEVGASVTKKTLALVYPDGEAEPTSGKATKAASLGIPILTVSAFRTKFL